MKLTDLEKKYYLCQPLTKKEWQSLAMYWGSQLAELRTAIKQRYAIKDSPVLATCVIQDNPKESQLPPKGVNLSSCGLDQKEKK